MKLPLAMLLLTAPVLQAQTEPPRPKVGSMITPRPPAPARASLPRGPQCRVVVIPTSEEVHNVMDSGPLIWDVTWDPSFPTGIWRTDVQFALDEWSGIIQNTTDRIANPFPITIAFANWPT